MKKAIFIVSCLFCATSLLAQTDQDVTNADPKDRIYVGGGLGLQFGAITNIEVSPIIGYRFTNTFSAGIGLTYIYFKREFDNFDDLETNIYGYRVFARQNIQQQFFAQAEFENLSLEFFNIDNGTTNREWVPGFLIGGGYFQPIGRNAGFNITALYNVLFDDQKSPYNSPLVLRIGLTLGF